MSGASARRRPRRRPARPAEPPWSRQARRAPRIGAAPASGPYSTSAMPRSGPALRSWRRRASVAKSPPGAGVERPVVVQRRARSAPVAGVVHAGGPRWCRRARSPRMVAVGRRGRAVEIEPGDRRGRRAVLLDVRAGGPRPPADGRRAPRAAAGAIAPATSISSVVPTSRTIHGRSALPCGQLERVAPRQVGRASSA